MSSIVKMSDPEESHHKDLDRQMVRHLLRSYSRQELALIFREESQSLKLPTYDTNSLISILTNSTGTTGTAASDRSSIFDNASISTASDAASTASSNSTSIFSNVSSKLLGRKSSHSSRASQPSAPSPAVSSSASITSATPSASSSSRQKASYSCGFCSEDGIVRTCTRKNDLKRHIEDFHNPNAQWHCRHKGCGGVFDYQTSYKSHLKQFHGGSRLSLDEAQVAVCPQVVFACGFEWCQSIFEATGDLDAPVSFKHYVAHIVAHFDDLPHMHGEWKYSVRFCNLLRQSQLVQAWEALSNDPSGESFTWTRGNSMALRRRLESRHFSDPTSVIRYALRLGQPGASPIPGDAESRFALPLRDSCTEYVPGHINNRPNVSTAAVPPSLDFRISRGSNPALANYLASQRQGSNAPSGRRASRRAHYSSRSAGVAPSTSQNSPHLQISNPMNPQFMATPPVVPSVRQGQVYNDNRQSGFSRGQQASAGGIIADDLHSLRHLAGGQPGSVHDIEMPDAEMLARDFQHGYTGVVGMGIGEEFFEGRY